MMIVVDADSLTPPYEQIRAQIETMAASGVLPEGTRLPPIRQLAADLDLAPGTINRAYRELESAGILTTRGRHGTFVSAAHRVGRRERSQRLAHGAEQFARLARQLGMAPDESLSAVRHALDTGA